MAFDLTPYLVGHGPEALTGMQGSFESALANMFAGAPPEIQQNLRIFSGYRSPERQAQLYDAALQKYGSPEAARKWVAPPGHSNHNKGQAADLRFLDPAARQWAHQHAGEFGLNFPLSNEAWHIEPVGIRGPNANQGQGPTVQRAAAMAGPPLRANEPFPAQGAPPAAPPAPPPQNPLAAAMASFGRAMAAPPPAAPQPQQAAQMTPAFAMPQTPAPTRAPDPLALLTSLRPLSMRG